MSVDIETHPWTPFLPKGSKVLIMGTFPPGEHRWSMDFYYPNPTNDFWKMCGLIFFNNPDQFKKRTGKGFDKELIIPFLKEKGIALNDTGYKVRRLKGNASDKFLEIIEPVDLLRLLKEIPDCRNIATTGKKAAGVIAELTATEAPDMGECVVCSSEIREYDGLKIWRMPSTSRAYPLALEKKAAYYKRLFEESGIEIPSF